MGYPLFTVDVLIEGGGKLSCRERFQPQRETSHKQLQRELKQHHIDTCQGSLCQGQAPRDNANKSYSTDVPHRRMDTITNVNRAHPGLGPFFCNASLIGKTKSAIQGIRLCCSYSHYPFLEIKYTTLLWQIPMYKMRQLIFNTFLYLYYLLIFL